MAKYKLIPFTQQSLNDANKRWEGIAGEDGFDLEFAPMFTWAQGHIEHQDGDSMAFDLHNNDNDNTDALVEIVTSRKGALSKLLKVIPSPEFWDVNNRRNDIVQLYTETFFGLITLGGFGASRKVKIYGRDDEMMSILRSIHSAWAIPKSTAEFEGRFLAITLN
jgi:hypothetical protein